MVCNQLAEHKVVGSIGILAEHTQIKIVDPETGKEVPEGGEGVLRGTGQYVAQLYFTVCFYLRKWLSELLSIFGQIYCAVFVILIYIF